MQRVQITSPGIKRALRRYDYSKAIAECIWNGFDAEATRIVIDLEANEIGTISKISVTDDGYGIPYEDLKSKFMPFFESEKVLDPTEHRNTSAIHGKNGVGRLTFFQFASRATWKTTYIVDGQPMSYEIVINADGLDSYSATDPLPSSRNPGTMVYFDGIDNITSHNFDTDIWKYLTKEFGWFLELNLMKGFRITLNGIPFDYSNIIGEKDSFTFSDNGLAFDIRYVRWNVNIYREYSRYYFINSAEDEIGKETTTLNNKGDHFYHSVYIRSSYFDVFSTIEVANQIPLIGYMKGDETYKKLMESVNRFLRDKRKPFLFQYTDQLIAEFEEDDAFPKFNDNEWDKFRKQELEDVIRELYQVEPKIFLRLNTEQRKTFAHFLNLIIDSGEKDKLFDVLQEIVSLDPEERGELAEVLRTSKLSGIVKTIRLIEDRYRTISQLRQLVFNLELKANERDHIQKFVEKHYWIFGEQYHLVTAAEPKFEEALRRHIYLLTGEKKDVSIDHQDKMKEMDIFLVRQLFHKDVVQNIVVELKHPKVSLGEKELSQVKKYMRVVLNEPEFNGENHRWEFYLVGNKFDSQGYMKGEIESQKHHGEKSLIYSINNYRIYAKTWSDIFADFEVRHRFLNEKLNLERSRLVEDGSSADRILQNANESSAIQPAEIGLPIA